jgi:transposase-like protein DUF772
MMAALLLYAHSQGIYSSRRIARGCEERLDFAAVTGTQRPDFRTISEFRKRHLAALSGLFRQVLKLYREAGLVKLGHVALDGTKIKANAGINKAMSYGRMKPASSISTRPILNCSSDGPTRNSRPAAYAACLPDLWVIESLGVGLPSSGDQGEQCRS